MSDWSEIREDGYHKIKVGDTVKAFHPLSNAWVICEVDNLLDDKRIWVRAASEDGFRFVCDLTRECVYLFEQHFECTCGAKHTNSPNFHLPYCECNCEEF